MHKETIIIGAGPAGIQLGCFLQQGGFDYLIIEKNDVPGSFFQKHPQTGKLISINKKYTGYSNPEFNLRHDWNSLLSDNGPLFTSYSNDYYPKRDDLLRYLYDFTIVNNIVIQYGTNVTLIEKINNGYKLIVSYQDTLYVFTCTKLIVASGLVPRIPQDIVIRSDPLEKYPIPHYSHFPKDYFLQEENLAKYINKTLCIIGNGNSAMELANHLVPYCSSIIIYGKKPQRLSIQSNYTGDVRALYLGFLDTFLLKSLNAIDYIPESDQYYIEKKDDKYMLIYNKDILAKKDIRFLSDHLSFDHMILATGWEFDSSMFSFPIEKKGRLPIITPEFESVSNQDLYFIGSLSHSLDHKVSSGGFIHGFRYSIKYLYQLKYVQHFDTHKILCKDNWIKEVSDYVFFQLNQTSAIYQMHGRFALIFFKENKTNSITIIRDVCIDLYHYTVHEHNPLSHVEKDDYVFIVTLEFNSNKNDRFSRIATKESHSGTEYKAKLIHPIIKVYKNLKFVKELHCDEELLAKFIYPEWYNDRLEEFLRKFF